VDLALGIGLFRWYGSYDAIYQGFAAQAVVIGVWGRAALLACLYGVFLRSDPVAPDGPPRLAGAHRRA
jgi:hypothetical protein